MIRYDRPHRSNELVNNVVMRHMGQHTKFCYLSHRRVAMAQARLRMRLRAVLLEPSLLVCTKYKSRGRLKPIVRPLFSLDQSKWTFKGDVCACAISTKIACDYPQFIILSSLIFFSLLFYFCFINFSLWSNSTRIYRLVFTFANAR